MFVEQDEVHVADKLLASATDSSAPVCITDNLPYAASVSAYSVERNPRGSSLGFTITENKTLLLTARTPAGSLLKASLVGAKTV